LQLAITATAILIAMSTDHLRDERLLWRIAGRSFALLTSWWRKQASFCKHYACYPTRIVCLKSCSHLLEQPRVRILLWATSLWIFRPPQSSWQQHLLAVAMAASTVLASVLYFGLADRHANIQRQIHAHTNVSIEQAINFSLCGKYGYIGTTSANLITALWAAPNEPVRNVVTQKYNSIENYCKTVEWPYTNNENSPFLIYIILISKGNPSISDLAFEMTLFRLSLLSLCLYILALFGLGMLPIFGICLATGYMLALVPGDQIMSYYPGFMVLLLFTSALVAFSVFLIREKGVFATTAVFAGVGGVLGFVFNYRTPYGVVMAAQIVIALIVYQVFVPRLRPGGRLAKYVGIACGLIFGFLAFQASFIKPIERGQTQTYHTVWHTIVLGLANPPSELSEREEIEWVDGAGLKILNRLRPDLTSGRRLSPSELAVLGRYSQSAVYENTLKSYYINLWRQNADDMLNIYLTKVFQLSGTMPLARSLLSDGYAWLAFLVAAGLCAVLYLSVSPWLSIFMVSLSLGVALISVEQIIVMPEFSIQLQGGLATGFAALLALFLNYPLACLILAIHRKSFNWQTQGRLLVWLSLCTLPCAASFLPFPPALYRFPITPLDEHAWTLVEPTRLTSNGIVVQGTAPFSAAYAAVSSIYQFPRGARVAAAGIVRHGGLVLGLLNSEDRWAKTAAVVTRGRFRISVQVPTEGPYRVVIANNLPAGTRVNDAEITEIGIVGLAAEPAGPTRDAPRKNLP
jgi:hypothetical protein